MPTGITVEQSQRLVVWCASLDRGAKRPPLVSLETDIKKTRRRTCNRQRGRRHILPSPLTADATATVAIGAPRPTRSRMTMTSSRFPGSRVVASDHLPRDFSIPSGIYGRQLSAYSCGGSRGVACNSRRTAFPWLALASTTDHKTGICPSAESTVESAGRGSPAEN